MLASALGRGCRLAWCTFGRRRRFARLTGAIVRARGPVGLLCARPADPRGPTDAVGREGCRGGLVLRVGVVVAVRAKATRGEAVGDDPQPWCAGAHESLVQSLGHVAAVAPHPTDDYDPVDLAQSGKGIRARC